MALNEQEKQILQRGLELGKSKEETKRAISNYRAEQQQIETERGNLGTGFTPTREFTGEENVAEFAETTARNIPRSASQFGRNVLSAVTNPIETGKSIFNLVQGAAGKGAQALAENTEAGQRFLETAQQSRQERGVEALPTDEEGNIQAPNTEDMQAVDQVGNFLQERYGGVENFKETVAEDPVGVLADFAGVVSGTGLAARGAGLTGTARRLTQAGASLDPGVAAGRAVGKVSQGVRSAASNVASRAGSGLTPTSIAERLSAQALKIPAGRRSKIVRATGGETPEQYLANRGISGTIDEMITQTAQQKTKAFQGLREQLRNVDATYTSGSDEIVDTAKTALDSVLDEFKGTVGNDEFINELASLRGKDQWTLSDIQRSKEMLDQLDIFKTTGDIKTGAVSQGLKNVRDDLKNFIESEGEKFNVPVQQLNREVSGASQIGEALSQAGQKADASRAFGMLDMIATGGGGATLGLDGAVLGLLASKAISSPRLMSKLAKSLNKLSDKEFAQIQKTGITGRATDNAREAIQKVMEDFNQEDIIAPAEFLRAQEQAQPED